MLFYRVQFLHEIQVKDKLGGRVRLMVNGAAPWSEEVEEFLRVAVVLFFKAMVKETFCPFLTSD